MQGILLVLLCTEADSRSKDTIDQITTNGVVVAAAVEATIARPATAVAVQHSVAVRQVVFFTTWSFFCFTQPRVQAILAIKDEELEGAQELVVEDEDGQVLGAD
ncbi:hypothetical protein F0562_015248 [Nyssa sinensis]|uniref:Uncharacterized protein n=1 Tax=Nyssa sinensis TaxID=561372 RepID=A0A5J4ZKS0_9ASTE|nr:hypothetical protein F0562_015248 [Nyssa sinensis]